MKLLMIILEFVIFLLPIILNILLNNQNTPSLQEVIIVFGVVYCGKQYEI